VGWAYRILVGKPLQKRPFGRPRRMWKNNVKMKIDLTEMGGVGSKLCPVVGLDLVVLRLLGSATTVFIS
jgi:hypothetical protein